MKKILWAGFAAVLMASTSLPALAEETPAAVTQLLKSLQITFGTPIKYEKFEGDNSVLTITGISADRTELKNDVANVTAASIRMEGIGAAANDLIPVEKGEAKDVKLVYPAPNGKSLVVDIPSITMVGWAIPVYSDVITPLQGFQGGLGVAQSFKTSPITITLPDETALHSDGYESSFEGDRAKGTTTKYQLKDFVLDEASLTKIDQGGVLNSMGYTSVSVGLNGDATTVASGENFALDFSFTLHGKDMANLVFTGSFSDIPMAVVAELVAANQYNRDLNFEPLMPQIQNASIKSAKLQLNDQSLVKKLIPIIAKAQGTDVDGFISTTSAIAQAALGNFKSPDFTLHTISAINTFLKDPKTLIINVSPANPVKFSEIISLDGNNPAAGIALLGISVSANE